MTSRTWRLAVVLMMTSLAATARAQDEGPAGRSTRRVDGPWFGVPLPPGPEADAAVLVGSRAPRPVAWPADPATPEVPAVDRPACRPRDHRRLLEGEAAPPARSAPASCGDAWLGCCCSTPPRSGRPAVARRWYRRRACSQWRRTRQPACGCRRPWRVALRGEAAFGAGSADVLLASAIPVVPTTLPNGPIEAPLVWVGSGGAAVLPHLDVRGRIAVQLTVPQGHTPFERGAVTSQARALFDRGAVACAHCAAAARQRTGVRLLELRRPVLQHWRPRRLVPRGGAR